MFCTTPTVNYQTLNFFIFFEIMKPSVGGTNPVYGRRVNSFVLVCSLSSHRHSYIHQIICGESHTNVRNHESVGDLLLVYRYTCTFGLGLRHKFPFTVTGLSYQDPICLFRFIKFIKTKFQRTPRLCRV